MAPHGFLSGGEAGALMRARDWSGSPLGDPSAWPQSLRSVVGLLLTSKFPMFVAWGPELGFLYNDPYAEILGAKHPAALGTRFRDVWSEIWPDISPLIDAALAGEASYHEDLPLVVDRHGFDEPAWFTFSYSPVRDESGRVAGMFCVVAETTQAVLARRRQALLAEVEDALLRAADPRQAVRVAVELLGRHLGADRVGYGEVQGDDATVVLGSCHASGVAPLEGPIPLDGFGPAMVARQRQGLTQSSDDVAVDPEQDPAVWAAIDARAFASVPLVRDGRFVASLYVSFRGPHRWTEEELRAVEEVAARTWAAVGRARAEERLRASEERYRRIVEGADDFAIVTLDEAGVITGWNTGAERVLGFSEDEAVGRPGAIFFTPEDQEHGAADHEMTQAASSGRAVDERWHQRKDGSRFWGSGLMMRLDGSGDGFLKIFRDRTAEHEAEAALRESEAQVAGVLDGMAEGFVLLDRDFRILRINAEGLRVDGRPASEIVGRSHWEVWPGSEEGAQGRLYKRLMREGEAGAIEERYAFPDREVWFEVRAYPVPEGLAIFYRDITARKRADARLAALARLTDRLRDGGDPTAVAFAAAETLGEALGASRVGYGTIDHDADTLHVERDWTAPGVDTLAGVTRLRDYGSFIDSLKRGELIAIGDTREDPRTAGATAALEGRHARSFVNVPVIEQGRLVAVLFVNDARVRDWAPDELAFVRDVAERTRIAVERTRGASALEDSEARYRTLFEAIDSGFCIFEMMFDQDGRATDYRFLEVNPAFERQTGLVGAVGRRIREFAPDHEEAWFERYGRVALTGEPLRIEGGAAALGRWFDINAFRVGAPGQRRVAALFNDISARRAAEERLRELNETLEERVAERTAERDRLWTLSEDMLARADYQGMMSAVSPAWTRVLGWSETELLTRPYSTFMHPEDTDVTLAALARMGETGQPTRFENRIATLDGGWKPIEWTVAPEPDSPNFIAVGRDLSAVKTREEELAAAQEQLRQSQKMEAVGQLTGGLAHDFNNILAGISGSLEMMDTRIAQGRVSDVERYMRAAQGAARRAAALTHRLLAFSRRQTLEPKPTDVNRLVAGMEELIRRTVGPGVAVEAVAKAGLWPTLVDPHQLENALLNLCINARDAMPEGGRIVIETSNRWLDERAARERDLPPGQYVSMCVSDNGTGMTPDVAARAFDPFFTTKPIGQGTGLGLSMIYGFARQSGGQVRIYSEVGAGTMVCVYLPRHQGQDVAAPVEAVEAVEPGGTGETVLVIDDEPLVRMLVVDVLDDLGYAAVEAGDGPEGLKVLRSDARVDLLVTDVGLPGGMNGRQVADAARELRPGLPVLFMTGYAENAVLSHGHLDPGMAVMTKPFDMARLAGRIRDMIAAR